MNASINTASGNTDGNGQYSTTVSNTTVGSTEFTVQFDNTGDGILNT